MADDLTAVRARLRLAAGEAEKDPQYRALLQDDPVAALARFDLKPEDVNVGFTAADVHRTLPPDDCADFTCLISECPASCYVTVPTL